jgi:glycerol-3-phosphate dehydrogenase (NAD(P)+)
VRVSILGAGNWGTTFAIFANQVGIEAVLWEFDPQQAQLVADTRVNTRYLPGIAIADDVIVTSDLSRALDADLLVLAVPAQICRSVLQQMKQVGRRTLILSLIKGIEQVSLARISEICLQELDGFEENRFAVLSGPTIAPEIARGLPASAVVASASPPTARRIQEAFSAVQFRLYSSDDVIGVELGGALKNVIALAAGVCDGMRLGDNAKGALMTRGLAEMTRLGAELGARKSTFSGLSGLGDLVTTCASPWSRNRRVGERLGSGERPKDVLASLVMVAEGVWTARAARDMAVMHKVDVPITQAVCDIVFTEKSPGDALTQLMLRELKAED